MTAFELLTNKELNGVCDYSQQSLDYISRRVAIYKDEELVKDPNEVKKALKAEVKDFFVEENNRIAIYV